MKREKIEQLKRQIRYKENLIKEYVEFQKILEEAIDQFIKNKFKRLFNAFKKYARPDASPEAQFEEVRECWGNDFISDRTFKAIEDEWREYQDYSVARCVDECLYLFNRKVTENEKDLYQLKKELNWLED